MRFEFPKGVKPQTYVLSGTDANGVKASRQVKIAFSDGKFFISGLASKSPEEVYEGTYSGTTASIPSFQIVKDADGERRVTKEIVKLYSVAEVSGLRITKYNKYYCLQRRPETSATNKKEMDIQQFNNTNWSRNIILVDGDYIDSVAFNLSVNFERMLGRRIPKADLARWIDCVALDGGMRESRDSEGETQVIFIHSKEKAALENFAPGDYEADLNAKAFKDRLGEFVLSSYPVEEVVKHDDFFLDILKTVVNHKDVHRVMAIPNAEHPALWDALRHALRDVDDEEKRVTLFAMQPLEGGNFKQEILGYSLMNALGIKGNEL